MSTSVGYHGFMGGPRSMGRVGYEFLSHLLRKPAYDACFFPYPNDVLMGEWEEKIRRCIPALPDFVPDQLVHFSSVLEAAPSRPARQNVAWMFYELTSLPRKIVEAINANDHAFATSGFVASVFREAGVTVPVRVLGHGYDPAIYRFSKREPESPFEFLCVAEHTPRKNLYTLVEAFDHAFGSSREVRLTLKLATHGAGDLAERTAGRENIHLLTDHLPREEDLVALYQKAHCFVLPTRGEGFGMPMLEAMATGLPLIVTDHGGHLDFCHESNSYLIRNRGFVPSDPECFPHVASEWADPDPDHLVELLRAVRADYDEALDRARRGWDLVRDQWTWEAVLNREFP